MIWRRHLHWYLSLVLAAGCCGLMAEEPGYVPDPEIEKQIDLSLNPDKAVAYPAMKQLIEMSAAAERALNHRLFEDKTPNGRRALAELIARCCVGRTGYRVTLELSPEGAGR